MRASGDVGGSGGSSEGEGAVILNANALDIPVASGSVQCIVTSPPYYGLRDYGVAGQIGLEQTPDEYIANLVAVGRECWRVLRDDGVMWMNLGDSYAGNGNGCPGGAKPKDLLGIPWRVALAFQADGWYLRSDIIWHKPNPMPESVTDRPTKSHEYIFLLTKSERYFYDGEAVKETAKFWEGQASCFERSGPVSQHVLPGQSAAQHRPQRNGKGGKNSFRGQGAEREGATGPANRDGRELQDVGYSPTRNLRSVWTVATAPYSEVHFATYPPKLIEPCILAGTSAKGQCPKCGAPWKRCGEKTVNIQSGKRNGNGKGLDVSNHRGEYPRATVDFETTGWRPTCSCPSAEPVPQIVLDPFNGSGTTGLVAVKHHRRYIGVELNTEYIGMSERRLASVQQTLFAL